MNVYGIFRLSERAADIRFNGEIVRAGRNGERVWFLDQHGNIWTGELDAERNNAVAHCRLTVARPETEHARYVIGWEEVLANYPIPERHGE